MYCIRCGKQIGDGVKYCMFCGAPTEEGRKAQARPEPDTASIPTDFFSRRMQEEQDDFTIAIPQDFIQKPAPDHREPDPAGEMEYTQMVSRQEIAEAMQEQLPEQEIQLPEEEIQLPEEEIQPPEGLSEQLADMIDTRQSQPEEAQEIEDEAYTHVISRDNIHAALASLRGEEAEQPQEIESLEYSRVMSKEEAREAAAKLGYGVQTEPEDTAAEPEADDIESEEFTRVISRTEIREAQKAEESEPEEETDVTKIPDIPIPGDFVAPQPVREERVYANPDAAYRRNQLRYREEPEEDEMDEEDGPEQLISVRGIIVVAMVVIVLFAIAVGAVVMALQGGEPQPAGSGSDDTGISFSYGESAD